MEGPTNQQEETNNRQRPQITVLGVRDRSKIKGTSEGKAKANKQSEEHLEMRRAGGRGLEKR